MPKPPPTRPVVVVTQVELPPVPLAALTAPSQRLELSFRTGGVVQDVRVAEGALVKRGTVLARLDPTELAANVKAAEEALDRAKRAGERARALVEARAGNRADAEDAATGVAVATAQLEQARFARDRGVIIAPVDGRVERRLADPGEIVGPGQPVLVVAQNGRGLTAKAYVDDQRLRFVEVGSVVHAQLHDAPIAGTVTRIGSSAGPLGQVEVEMSFEGAKAGDLPLGVPLHVDLVRKQLGWRVPALAVVRGHGGGAQVFVDVDKPHGVDVRVLDVDDTDFYVDSDTPLSTLVLPGARAL